MLNNASLTPGFGTRPTIKNDENMSVRRKGLTTQKKLTTARRAFGNDISNTSNTNNSHLVLAKNNAIKSVSFSIHQQSTTKKTTKTVTGAKIDPSLRTKKKPPKPSAKKTIASPSSFASSALKKKSSTKGISAASAPPASVSKSKRETSKVVAPKSRSRTTGTETGRQIGTVERPVTRSKHRTEPPQTQPRPPSEIVPDVELSAGRLWHEEEMERRDNDDSDSELSFTLDGCLDDLPSRLSLVGAVSDRLRAERYKEAFDQETERARISNQRDFTSALDTMDEIARRDARRADASVSLELSDDDDEGWSKSNDAWLENQLYFDLDELSI